MTKNESTHVNMLNNCLRQQLDELDLLKSIFSDELKISDFSVEADFNQFLDKTGPPPDTQLQFYILLNLTPSIRLDIHVELPHLYPILELAKVSVLSTAFSNNGLQLLRQELNAFLETQIGTGGYLFQAYQWIQDNAEIFRHRQEAIISINKSKPIESKSESIEMERLWIYSHHLRCITKRRDMVILGKQLELTGFHRPGRPGIICVEGRKVNTQEFWRTVRSWNWQKIGVRRSDTETVVGYDAALQFRRFKMTYHELIFNEIDDDDDSASGEGEKINQLEAMDMGLFLKFLNQHQCGDVKRDLFGFE